ncbi:endonuclease/exonuclease/phosphatase family protein [Polaribacter sp. R77954]|uniref:endonuclease/exonuclease/phosphatase family protein n=1 Tax=Polaribacter sp. R77954 TaxID=3093870 RepID=UPI0037CB51AB
MKHFIKYFLRLLVLLIIAFVGFFFWASSSTLNEKEYTKLIKVEAFENSKNDSIFRIATYNIGYLSGMTNNLPVDKPKSLFDKNLQKVTLEIQKLQPDFIAFQEIDYDAARSYHINQEKEIARLGYGFIARTINWDEHYVPFPYWPLKMHFGKMVSGQSVLSKYPLIDNQRNVLQRVEQTPFYIDAFYLERLAQVVTVDLNDQKVVLINVHLEAFDTATRVHQFKEVLAIFNQYKNNYPTILLGDFNSKARDKDAAIQKLLSMKDIGNAAFDANDIKNTFNTKQPSERLDYIFYTKNTIDYISGKVLSEFGEASDHLPVYMEFKVK